MPAPDQLFDLRAAITAHLTGHANLPELVAGNVILGDSQETPEDFDVRRKLAIGKARHKLGIVLYEGVLSNESNDGSLDLNSQHLIEFYRSPQRSSPRAANNVRSSEQIILDLVRSLHGYRPANAQHCDLDLRFVSAVPLADPHYESWLLTFNAAIDLTEDDYDRTLTPA